MSWLYSRALEAEYLVECLPGGELSAQLKSIDMPDAFCVKDKITDFSRLSRFGMIFEPLTESHGEALLTWFLEAFRARTSAQREKAQESPESVAGCGEKWPESFVKYDPDSRSWKTPQCSLFGGLTKFSGTWPRWGTMRNGACSERMTPELRTSESESGFLPTPCAVDAGSYFNRSASPGAALRPTLGAMAKHNLWPTPRSTDGSHGGRVTPRKSRNGGNLIEAVSKEMFKTPQARDFRTGESHMFEERQQKNLNDQIGGQLNPTWVEWLMGWPLGWTDLKPLAMDKYQQWQQGHGKYCTAESPNGEARPVPEEIGPKKE